jgi:hypothetical protein
MLRPFGDVTVGPTPEVRVVDDDAVHFVWFVHNAN